MKRQKTRGSHCKSRHRTSEYSCSFEVLEARQMLAYAAFESITNTLDIIYEPGETLVTVGHNDQYLTINGVEAEAWNSQSKQIRIAQIENMVVSGNASTTQSLVSLTFVNDFNEINSPLLQYLNIAGVNDVYFAGQIVLGSDMIIAAESESLSISQSIDSALTIHGDTVIRSLNGNVDLSKGLNDFVGPVSIKVSPAIDQILAASGQIPPAIDQVRIADSNSLELHNVDIAGKFRITAETVSSTPGSVITVGNAMYIRAGRIALGDNLQDHFAPAKLNFKSNGIVRISADTNLFLIGSSFAESASLRSTGWIRDAGGSRINIADRLELRAANQISLGEQVADEFNSGELIVVASGSASIIEDSSTNLVHVDVNGNLKVYSAGDIQDTDNALIQVNGAAIFYGTSIQLGDMPTNVFRSKWLNFNSSGTASVYSTNDIKVFGNNTARDLTLFASGGSLSDVAGTQTIIQNHTTLSGSAITWGKDGAFMSNTLTLKSDGNVTVRESNDMMLTGANVANSFRLLSPGAISNTENASLVATYRLDLAAASTDLGRQIDDYVQFSSLRFNTTGAMNLAADSNIRILLDNHASLLNLRSTGNIVDQPGSNVLIEQAAYLTGVDVILGDVASECFKVLSNVVVVSASGVSNITLGC